MAKGQEVPLVSSCLGAALGEALGVLPVCGCQQEEVKNTAPVGLCK